MYHNLSVVQWIGPHSSKVLIEVRFLSDGPINMTDNLFTYPEQWKLFGIVPRTPLPEVMYLDGEEAWIQWDLAVKLQDKRNGL